MKFREIAVLPLVLLLGCSSASEQTEGNEGQTQEDALFSSCADWEGTERYDGIDGSYERVGLHWPNEMSALKIGAVSSDGRNASYERTITRFCTSPGCNVETGSMTMLADNAAFNPNFTFTPQGATEPSEMYWVLGLQRSQGVVTAICVGRMITPQKGGLPFELRRVGL